MSAGTGDQQRYKLSIIDEPTRSGDTEQLPWLNLMQQDIWAAADQFAKVAAILAPYRRKPTLAERLADLWWEHTLAISIAGAMLLGFLLGLLLASAAFMT